VTDYNSDAITVKGHMWNEVLRDATSFISKVCIQCCNIYLPKSKSKYTVQGDI